MEEPTPTPEISPELLTELKESLNAIPSTADPVVAAVMGDIEKMLQEKEL